MTRWIRLALPFVSLAAIAFAAWHVAKGYGTKEPSPVPQDLLPKAPYERSIAGSGIIEAESENVEIGTAATGIVLEVYVREGDEVIKDAPLFRVDDRELQAQKDSAEAVARQSLAELERIKSLPREEEIPVYRAAVAGAEAELAERKQRLERFRQVSQTDAITGQELDTATKEVRVAEATLARSRAQLEFFLAGASQEEIAVADATLASAQADVRRLEAEIAIRTVRAPVDGMILDLEVQPGEQVSVQGGETALIFARKGPLQVRVSIDEFDIPGFDRRAAAIAMLKGNNQARFSLHLAYVEPYVIPKRSLTGEATERIDTRVLQIVYEVGESEIPLYVGQQVDVFIERIGNTDVPAPPAPRSSVRRPNERRLG